MKKRIIYAIILLVLVIAVLAGIKALQIKAMIAGGKKFVMPAETVTTTTAHSDSWDSSLSAVGTLTAVQGVTVAGELAGKIVNIGFQPGSLVKKGDILVAQDVAAEQAQLQGALAQVQLTRSTLERDKKMLAERIISQADYDTALAQKEQAEAQVANIRATIAKKTIRAPFTGRLGIRQVNLGQMLRENDPVVTLQSLNPIFVDFALPQQQLGQLKVGQTIRVTSDAIPGLSTTGRISAINPLIDADTRNVKVQATIENALERLRPGMFVNVAVGLPVRQKVLTVPTTSVLYNPYGDSVFLVVDAKEEKELEAKEAKASKVPGKQPGPQGPPQAQTGKVLRQQFVRLGEKRGDLVVVTSGLKEGEVVVSTGVFKLHNGQSAIIDNKLAPNFQKAPKPENN
ncbi:MexH family multidrug efflux RND transporter periplasmic adaptor subunit [Geomonas silvestris]|uniref:MexH family multidrug efflux RND transporter periplasmic adaptor subunit n=1 Tax=Geomonas silvestris TaxID=2740184 RepID=A0A6V8MCZ7_9BACT|nr:efflux RND transporter periplasmic adaptor subunit [Geomonas silvestris]GFO57827.1 MexH family multidrug efflux RND transporter periplasmic adaptor subunit [Geomonas silvestris]